MIKVAHVMYRYLGLPETFIWQYLRKSERFYPVIIADFLENMDLFHLPTGKFYQTCGPRLKPQWLIDNWCRRILKRPYAYKSRIIRREGIRIIHAHFGPTGCDYLPVALLNKIPLITNFYGVDLSAKDLIESNREAYAQLFSEGTFFLLEGPCMLDKLVSLGCPEEKIFIQRIALDLKLYTFQTRSWNGNRPIRLLFTGRFIEKKGLEYALQALSRLKKDYSFHLRIIGAGQLEEKLRRLAFDLGLSEKIIWLGMQSHQMVIQELQSSDLLIQPSVTASNGDSEGGAPTIILEAQACGVPVISTTHADIPYITCPSKSAFLSSERDVDSLADNIRYLFDNSELWPRMGKIGRDHVEKFHDIRKEILALEDVYTRTIVEKKF